MTHARTHARTHTSVTSLYELTLTAGFIDHVVIGYTLLNAFFLVEKELLRSFKKQPIIQGMLSLGLGLVAWRQI